MTKPIKSIRTLAPKPATARGSATAPVPKRVFTPTTTTKKARLIALLSRKSGADVPSLSTTLGWLPHTTRAALTGLRKAGYEIASVKPDNGKPLRYQIIGSPEADSV